MGRGKKEGKYKMKIVGNAEDLSFLGYIRQVVLFKYKKNMVSLLLEKGVKQRDVQGLLFY